MTAEETIRALLNRLYPCDDPENEPLHFPVVTTREKFEALAALDRLVAETRRETLVGFLKVVMP